jgi:hypothetical protein
MNTRSRRKCNRLACRGPGSVERAVAFPNFICYNIRYSLALGDTQMPDGGDSPQPPAVLYCPIKAVTSCPLSPQHVYDNASAALCHLCLVRINASEKHKNNYSRPTNIQYFPSPDLLDFEAATN